MQFLAAVFLFLLPFACYFDQTHFFIGYSLFWLLLLYLTGAILKKTGFGASLPPVVYLAGIVLMDAVSFLLSHRWGGFTVWNTFVGPEGVKHFMFPSHYLSAIFHLLLFSRMKCPQIISKWIAALAPGAFAVYIINTQKHVWEGYLCDRFVSWAFCSPMGIAVRAVAVSALFVAVSLIADWLRRRLFGLFRKR